MKHVIWKEGTGGPGVDAVREFLRAYNGDLLAMASRKGDTMSLPARGSFDADLRRWVKQFQAAFNHSGNPAVTGIKAKLPRRMLVETGEVDWGTRLVMGIDEALAGDDAILLPGGVVAKPSALTVTELAAAQPGDRFIGRAYRVAELDKLLTALGLAGKPLGTSSDKRIAPLDEGRFVVPDGHVLYNAAKEESECAALVQSFGVPNTNQWRRGPRVQDIEMLAPGTVIATLGTGVYLSDYSGKSHVGIFLWKTDLGLVMLDQYRGSDGTLGIRFKKFGAAHRRSRVSAAKYIAPGFSHRMEVVDEHGNKTYARDYSLDTVRYKTNLTSDGSEYYILLDDGTIARQDSAAHRHRTKEEDRAAAKELVGELFDGVDLMGPKDAGEKLRKALEAVKPAGSGEPTLQPR